MSEKQNPVSGNPNYAEVCPECGNSELETDLRKQKFLYGSEGTETHLSAMVPVFLCRNCGFEFTGEAAEEARHEAVCRHLRLMTPREIKDLRERYMMTRGELAELSRVGTASLARWESGILFQNGANDQLLYLLQFDHNVTLLRAREAAWVDGSSCEPRESQPLGASVSASEEVGSLDRAERRRCPIRGRFRQINRPEERRAAAAGWRP